tara:strand:+ start:319 stop:1098 length:780 start_codon:yes stop_codon:yes gene_type:complete
MDNIPILNSNNSTNNSENSSVNSIEDMLLYNNLGLESNGLTKFESDALENKLDIDNDFDNDLYEVINVKDDIINTLKMTNYNLTNIIFNFEDKISKIDKSISNKLSNISTKKDIGIVMNNNKKLKNQINIEREAVRKINLELLKTKNELDILKTTYKSLNKIYINNFQNDSPLFAELNNLKKEIDMLKGSDEQLLELKSSLKCKICYDNYINCLIEPCGHLAVCMDCINHMREITQTEEIKCPICNGFVINCKSVYLPI